MADYGRGLVTYPETVALATLLASPAWRLRVTSGGGGHLPYQLADVPCVPAELGHRLWRPWLTERLAACTHGPLFAWTYRCVQVRDGGADAEQRLWHVPLALRPWPLADALADCQHRQTAGTEDLPAQKRLRGHSVHAESAFAAGLAHARTYAAQHGHLATHRDTRVGSFPLGKWVHNQPTHALALPEEKAAALKEVDPWWNTPCSVKWQRSYYRARDHVGRHGPLDAAAGFPDTHVLTAEHGCLALATMNTSYQGFPLGKWLNAQRSLTRRQDAPGARLQALDAIDVWWSPPWPLAWQRTWHRIRAHVRDRRQGAAAGSWPDGSDGWAMWLSVQRTGYKQLRRPQQHLLAELGITAETAAVRPHEVIAGLCGTAPGLAHARAYAARHGHLAMPQKAYHEGFPLGRWLSEQRRHAREHHRGTGGRWPVSTLLTALDPWWNPTWSLEWQRSWSRVRKRSQSASAVNDGASTSIADPEKELAGWLRRQCAGYGTLHPEQRHLLAKIGVTAETARAAQPPAPPRLARSPGHRARARLHLRRPIRPHRRARQHRPRRVPVGKVAGLATTTRPTGAPLPCPGRSPGHDRSMVESGLAPAMAAGLPPLPHSSCGSRRRTAHGPPPQPLPLDPCLAGVLGASPPRPAVPPDRARHHTPHSCRRTHRPGHPLLPRQPRTQPRAPTQPSTATSPRISTPGKTASPSAHGWASNAAKPAPAPSPPPPQPPSPAWTRGGTRPGPISGTAPGSNTAPRSTGTNPSGTHSNGGPPSNAPAGTPSTPTSNTSSPTPASPDGISANNKPVTELELMMSLGRAAVRSGLG